MPGSNESQSRFTELLHIIEIGDRLLKERADRSHMSVSNFTPLAVAYTLIIQQNVNVAKPQLLLQYVVPDNQMFLCTFISLAGFDWSDNSSLNFSEGAFCSGNDAGGHIYTLLWLTQQGVSNPVSDPNANYLALANRPCIFLFPPKVTVNLLLNLPTTIYGNAPFGGVGVFHTGTPGMLFAGALHGWLVRGDQAAVFSSLQTSIGSVVGYPAGTAGGTTSAKATVPTSNPF
jgi:hypothetical protein